MSRIESITDGYVRVELRDTGDFGSVRIGGEPRTEEELRRDLDVLADAIRKRTNKFDDERGNVHIILEREQVCEHCGCPWTEKSPDYNGGCCDRDEKNKPISAEA